MNRYQWKPPDPHFYAQVYGAVRRIPRGKVATYGQISALLTGTPTEARTVGWALRALPNGSDVPWQRVINASGKISTNGREEGARVQRRLLEEEGVRFDESGKIDLDAFGWQPE